MGKYDQIGGSIGYIGSQPPFITGQTISVKLTIKNPTAEALVYVISMLLGAHSIGTFPSITVQPGATVNTAVLTGVAPALAGVYPIYIGVTVGNEDMPQMLAGSVTVNEPAVVVPDVEIVSLTWL